MTKKVKYIKTLVYERHQIKMINSIKSFGAALATIGLCGARIRNESPFFHKYYSSSSSFSSGGHSKENLPAFAANASRVFFNVLSERKEISKYLKGKSGVYCWVNLINGKYYIGSGVELSVRVSDYLPTVTLFTIE
jgi:hypothetical protein